MGAPPLSGGNRRSRKRKEWKIAIFFNDSGSEGRALMTEHKFIRTPYRDDPGVPLAQPGTLAKERV